MTPGARLAAAIEILELSEHSPGPADAAIARYFRGRRYAGAKDRRAISENVYGIWRTRARLDWWIGRAGAAPDAQNRVLAHAVLRGASAAEVDRLCTGADHAPGKLAESERRTLKTLEGEPLDHPEMPDWAAGEFPQWLGESLKETFGGSLAGEMAALNRPAALDLRVNTLKTDCARALKLLANDGIDAEPTPYSPIGLRVASRINLAPTTAFKGGFVEVQDEGAQLAALLADARPGMTVVDYCAGAGGKTLALAAAMKNRGSLIAHDSDAARLARMKPRLKRAGVTNLSRELPPPRRAERVLVDAPCSGTGRWRREPDARWRLTPEKLAGYVAAQSSILADAAGLVAPGGRLVYVTCSILREENEDAAIGFLADHDEFERVPVNTVWRDVIGTPAPDGAIEVMRFSPARHGTDGFYVDIFERTHG